MGVLALDGDSFEPSKPAKPLSIGALMLDITPIAGWQVERNDTALISDAALVMTAPLVDDYAASVNLFVTPLIDKPRLKDMASELLHAYPASFENFILEKQEQTTLNGIPAIAITATHRTLSPGVTSPNTLRMYQVLTIRNQELFVFSCTALDSNFAQYKSDFQFILDSVRWRQLSRRTLG